MCSTVRLIVACAGAAVGGVVGAQPTLTLLPPSTSFQVMPLDISDDGSVMAGFGGSNASWTWTEFDGVLPITSCPTLYINGDGTIWAGQRYINWNGRDRYTISKFVGGVETIIQPLPAWTGCDDNVASLTDISGDGSTIASLVWATCTTTAWVYRDATGWTQLANDPAFATQSHRVSKLSRDGRVGAGWSRNSPRRGCFWVDGQLTLIQSGDAFAGQAYALSENGRFVGGQTHPTGQFSDQWLFDRNTSTLINLGTVPSTVHPGNSIVMGGISNNGRVITGFRGFGGNRNAWIWTPTGGYELLKTYLENRGVNFANLGLDSINLTTNVSADGRYITAQCISLGGQYIPTRIDLGPQPCNLADVGSQGGVVGPDGLLDNNDFAAFITLFFQDDPAGDVGVQGGLPVNPFVQPVVTPDGLLDNNDFAAFITLFFQGCN